MIKHLDYECAIFQSNGLNISYIGAQKKAGRFKFLLMIIISININNLTNPEQQSF